MRWGIETELSLCGVGARYGRAGSRVGRQSFCMGAHMFGRDMTFVQRDFFGLRDTTRMMVCTCKFVHDPWERGAWSWNELHMSICVAR